MLGGVRVEEKLMKVTARILGEDYTIRGRMPQEHIERIAAYVDGKMLQISEAYPKLGTSRVAVLAAINMADELFKIKEQYDHLTQLLEEEWSQRHHASTREAAPNRETASTREAAPTRETASTREAAPTRDVTAGGGGPAAPELPAEREAETAAREVAAAEEGHLFTGDALALGTRGHPVSDPEDTLLERPVVASPGHAPEPGDGDPKPL